MPTTGNSALARLVQRLLDSPPFLLLVGMAVPTALHLLWGATQFISVALAR
jgi:hypothetical protein